MVKEALPLFIEHHKEISHFNDLSIKPNFEKYYEAEREGKLVVYTARILGVLVGYQFFFKGNSHQFSDSVQAYQDMLFIHPRHRGFGYSFLKWCEKQLKAEGVHIVYQHVNAKHDFSPMLKRQGYELVDLVFAKRLDS